MKYELSSSQWLVSKSNGMPVILATQRMSAERRVLSDCLLVLVSRWWGSVRYHCCHALAPPPCTCMAGIQQVGACSARAIPSHAQPSWQTTAECWTSKKKWGPQKLVLFVWTVFVWQFVNVWIFCCCLLDVCQINVNTSLSFQKTDMEEMTIWEQHTVTLSKVSCG